MDYVPKLNTKRDMRCLELPYATLKEALDCERRFASLSVVRNYCLRTIRFRLIVNAKASLSVI